MISRTVRYFKLMYIVAGILMSNEHVCETVDKIQIAPRVEVKEILLPKRAYRRAGGGASGGVEKKLVTKRSWLSKLDVFGLSRLEWRLTPKRLLNAFSIWTIPNYLVDCSTNYISKKFVINSDCDMIYNR